MGISKKTTYSICRRVENGNSVERQVGSGRPARKMSQKKREALVNQSHGKLGVSLRKIGRKFKIDKKYVSNILKENNVKLATRKSAPKYSEKQKLEQKRKLRHLSESAFSPSNGTEIIIDDESYFTFDGSDTANNKHFYCKEGEEVDDKVKFKRHKKFQSKLLVWLAISSRGHSTAFICPSGNSVNADIYEKQCIRSRLVRFIREKHSDGNFVFWPDMATAHYAANVIAAYNELNIPFIPKDKNVPNVPQLRPIERFWRNLKRNVYENGWEASTHAELKKRILLKIRQTKITAFTNLMRRVKTKILKASRYGTDCVL
ncbi:hypothetical protein Zmor_010764 [Zophobas morio]|uniref:Tc1-like transposase DDE domain-containing protein n=1 Tax=Zophobas morio TaxID=2755281 RepID=A0AA38ILE7_9CUCU|nr:hypothetical protein Zmor_010764 [Zophobas morio]